MSEKIIDICPLQFYTVWEKAERAADAKGERTMPRPKKCRRVCDYPPFPVFLPAESGQETEYGCAEAGTEAVYMTVDEYETIRLIDGEELSQGQRQLLAIARAAIADPPVLILDEATSSIDTRTEQIVQQGMDNLMKGRTVFVIAHRLSTIRNSDAIMVLEHGRIIERGTHEDLLKLKGTYYQLYTGKLELS